MVYGALEEDGVGDLGTSSVGDDRGGEEAHGDAHGGQEHIETEADTAVEVRAQQGVYALKEAASEGGAGGVR